MAINESAKARVKALAAAAAAVGAGAASWDDAEAGVFTAEVNEVIPQSSKSNPFVLNAFDLSSSFSSDFKISFMATDEDGVFFGLENNLSFINYSAANDPARWGSGVMIDAGAQQGVSSAGGSSIHVWDNATNSATTSNDIVTRGGNGKWAGQGTTGFMGIRFSDGPDFYYGWVQITHPQSGNESFTVNSWAMESDAGTGILTSASASGAAVPEPTSLGLFALCLGAAGIRSQRRRRQQHVS